MLACVCVCVCEKKEEARSSVFDFNAVGLFSHVVVAANMAFNANDNPIG
jgi:hypothetical protein